MKKKRISDAAKKAGLKEAEYLRMAVFSLMESGEGAEKIELSENQAVEIDRYTVRISSVFTPVLKSEAKRKGFGLGQVYIMFIQSQITSSPVLTDAEMQQLRESNRQLSFIGRNINQIARKLNEGFFHQSLISKDDLDSVMSKIDKNKSEINSLIRASAASWEDTLT